MCKEAMNKYNGIKKNEKADIINIKKLVLPKGPEIERPSDVDWIL